MKALAVPTSTSSELFTTKMSPLPRIKTSSESILQFACLAGVFSSKLPMTASQSFWARWDHFKLESRQSGCQYLSVYGSLQNGIFSSCSDPSEVMVSPSIPRLRILQRLGVPMPRWTRLFPLDPQWPDQKTWRSRWGPLGPPETKWECKGEEGSVRSTAGIMMETNHLQFYNLDGVDV